MDRTKTPLTAKETLDILVNLGLWDREIARLLGVESTTISRWRMGERHPTPENEKRIFEVGAIIKKILDRGEQITIENIKKESETKNG